MSDGDRPDDTQPNAAGVDVTLIDEMLRMTVRQRLEQNDRAATLAVRLRAAVRGSEGGASLLRIDFSEVDMSGFCQLSRRSWTAR